MTETEDYLRIFYCLSVIISVIDAANINCIHNKLFTIMIISNLGFKILILPCQVKVQTICLCLMYEIIFITTYSLYMICEEYKCQLWFDVYRQIFNTINIFLLCYMFKEQLRRRRNIELRVYIELPLAPDVSYDIVELQEDWVCCICLERDNISMISLRCGHTIHELCVLQWFSHSMTCPLCRTHI